MAIALNKKQHELLNSLEHDALVDIILHLIHDNKHAKATLIHDYLLSAPERLTAIEKEYNRQAKSKRFYDYADADAFYHALTRDIAQPLENLATVLPEPVEKLSLTIIHAFERFSEKTDTSSGSWMPYYALLIDAWMKSLAAQTNHDTTLTARKIVDFFEKEAYFGIDAFQRYHRLLGTPILRALRDIYHQKKSYPEAIALSLIIKDLDFLKMAVQNDEFYHSEQYFAYAKLLIDDVRADEAIELLVSMKKHCDKQCANGDTWDELLITALIEERHIEEAKEKAMAAFSVGCDPRFYRLYTKATGQNEENLPDFLRIANEKGVERYLCFAADIARFDLVDACITQTPKEERMYALAYLAKTCIRTLSSTLYKHGYAVSATLLRRHLVEGAIEQANRRYYNHAASDLKKAIDYSHDLNACPPLLGTQDYLQELYVQHARKTSLWSLMAEKIKGLSIRKDGIHYTPPR